MMNLEHMPSKWSSVIRYALALAFFVIALAVRWLIAPIESGLPFVTFYPVTVVTFYLCGIGPGIVLVSLCAICAYYFFIPPYLSFYPNTVGVTAVVTYLISAWLIWLIIRKMQSALDRLRVSEQRYQSVLDSQTEIICRLNANGALLYANDAFCHFFGKTHQELVGHNWQPIVYPEDVSLVSEKLNTLSPSHPVVQVENRIIAGNGEIRWGQFINQAFYKEGQLLEIQSVGRDITERKTLELALEANETEFRLLAEAMPQIVWITRADGGNIFFNHQWQDYTGQTLEESYEDGWNKPFHPEDRQRAWEAWQNAVNHNAAYSLECRLRRVDGAYRWWLVRGVPVMDQAGKICKWFGTCTDIHDLKNTANELKIADDRLNLAMEGSNIGVWDLDLMQDTAWRSLKHDQIFGYDSLQPQWGQAIALKHVAPEDHENFIRCFKDAYRTGLFFLECRIIHQDQSVHWINARAQVTYNENAQPVRMIGTVEDITERKLIEKERILAATIFDAQEGMFITDADKLILRVNAAFTRITGYTQQDVLNHNPHLFNSGRHDRDFYAAMWQSLTSRGVWEGEIWNRRKNGEIYPQYLIITAVKDPQGLLTHYVATFNDISRLKETEEHLQNAYLQLQQSFKIQVQQEKLASIGVLVGGLAHEINNPIMGIINYIEYAHTNLEAGRAHDMLGKALKEVNRIARLVHGMLAFVHQSSGVQCSTLSSVLDHVLPLVEGDLKKADITLHLDIPDDCLQLGISSDALEQILLNLLLNAIYGLKKTEKPRELRIAAQQLANGGAALLVQDNGNGVPVDIRQNIFDPFFTTKPPGEGTGLGLAISRQLAEAINGNLELVDSIQGACFKLSLPMPAVADRS